MVLIMHKMKKNLVVFLLVLLGMLISSIYHVSSREVKADKSNAMQVVKTVEAEPLAKVDFFTEYRLERDKLRSERAELLRESIKNANTEERRQAAQENVLKMVQEKQRETEMESLIKAKGFADVLVFCRQDSVSAVVKANSLSQDEVVQVADVIGRISQVKQENITISTKP